MTIHEKRLGGAGGCGDVQCMHSSCVGYHWTSHTRGVSRLDSKASAPHARKGGKALREKEE